MSLNIKHKRMALLALLLVLFAVILTQGCGTSQRECEAAPDGSTITINPSSQTMVPGSILNWTAVVRYPDDTPMPFACLYITGAQAVPNGTAYTFAYNPEWGGSPVLVNSGFRAKTDDNGKYDFATLISSGTVTSDTIYVHSGTAIGSAELQ